VTVDVITVVQQPTAVVSVVQQPTAVVSVVQVGPQGPTGSGAATVLNQSTPASMWHFTHTLARRPNATVYDPAGNVVLADINASATDITITLANAATGSVVLT
jgi:hypothetical protein